MSVAATTSSNPGLRPMCGGGGSGAHAKPTSSGGNDDKGIAPNDGVAPPKNGGDGGYMNTVKPVWKLIDPTPPSGNDGNDPTWKIFQPTPPTGNDNNDGDYKNTVKPVWKLIGHL